MARGMSWAWGGIFFPARRAGGLSHLCQTATFLYLSSPWLEAGLIRSRLSNLLILLSRASRKFAPRYFCHGLLV